VRSPTRGSFSESASLNQYCRFDIFLIPIVGLVESEIVGVEVDLPEDGSADVIDNTRHSPSQKGLLLLTFAGHVQV
jgi:hypothetical protein